MSKSDLPQIFSRDSLSMFNSDSPYVSWQQDPPVFQQQGNQNTQQRDDSDSEEDEDPAIEEAENYITSVIYTLGKHKNARDYLVIRYQVVWDTVKHFYNIFFT